MIVEPRPWIVGQALTGTNGMSFVATGPGAYKMAAPEPVEPEPPKPEVQELFCAGEVLPSNMQGTAKLCVEGSDEIVCLGAGDMVPQNAIGCIFVDERTLRPQWMSDPIKDIDIKPFVRQAEQPTKEEVEAGVCLWRNTTDGCLYTVTVEENGDCTWFSSDKRDTVDGYSEQGVADGSQIDIDGNAIAVGASVINFFNADGQYVNSKDCTDANDFSFLITAVAAGTDDAGNAYQAQDSLLELPNGDRICVKKAQDTFASLIIATEAGVDDAGNDYAVDDRLIQLPSGETICVGKTEDTFAGLIAATEAGTDDAGNDYAAGDSLIQLASGDLVCAEKTTDTFTGLIFATEAGTDDAGNAYAANDALLQLPSGELVCAKKSDEIGSPIEIDPEGDPANFPASSAPWEKRCLIDADGNMVGFVDLTGTHLIEDEDDEVGPNIDVADLAAAQALTGPVAPHDLQFVCIDGVACGFVVASGFKEFARSTQYVGDIICGEDANGVACEGVTTHVIYDGKTHLPIKKVSHCAAMCCEEQTTLLVWEGITTGQQVPAAQLANLPGNTFPFSAGIDFELQKAQDVFFSAEVFFDIRSFIVRGLLEISLDGGAWQTASGGAGDGIGNAGAGLVEQSTAENKCFKNVAKGQHTIEMRFTVNSVTDVQDIEGVPPFLARSTSNMYVNFVKNECLEVEL